MQLLRNDRVWDSATPQSRELRGTGRVWQLPVLEWEPWEQKTSPVLFPAWNRWQVNTSLHWEMQSGRMGLSLTFHNSSDILERTAHHGRTSFTRTMILVAFSNVQVELSLQTNDTGVVGMLKQLKPLINVAFPGAATCSLSL